MISKAVEVEAALELRIDPGSTRPRPCLPRGALLVEPRGHSWLQSLCSLVSLASRTCSDADEDRSSYRQPRPAFTARSAGHIASAPTIEP